MSQHRTKVTKVSPAFWMTVLVLGLAVVIGRSTAVSKSTERWAVAWAASQHGPYPSGNAAAGPELKFAFPDPRTGAHEQTFRLIVKPSMWGKRLRLRFSNAFGTQALTIDDVYVGLQATGGNLVPGTNRPVTFEANRSGVTIEPGKLGYSAPMDLSFVKSADTLDLFGRRLAVSFHVAGSSGPMTWHSTALTTSYVSAPGGGTHGREEADRAFPFSTTSWFFLDAVDVMAPDEAIVVAALGDSITNGSLSTLNGDDRWEDVLAYRLHAAYGAHVSVLNTAIGGNQVLGPGTYNMNDPFFGGPSALQRLERDVLSLSGLTAVVWLEGINDFGLAMPSPSAEAVIAGLREGVNRMHARGIKVIGGTLTSTLNGGTPAHATPETDAKRKAVNQFIRTGGLYDGVAEFDTATLDPVTGMLRPEFIPGSTTGGPGDRIHPNRAGYQAMGYAIDVSLFARTAKKRPTQ